MTDRAVEASGPVWRAIPGFPLYEVSNQGVVRSWRRRERRWRNPCSAKRDDPIELRGTVADRGYIAYILRQQDGKPRRMMGHRLVALAFLARPNGTTDVAHNDGNPSNNALENLRWATHRDNQMDMRRHGTMQDGQRSTSAKLDEPTVIRIRNEILKGPRGTARRLARELGVSPAQICRIAKGTRWRASLETYQ